MLMTIARCIHDHSICSTILDLLRLVSQLVKARQTQLDLLKELHPAELLQAELLQVVLLQAELLQVVLLQTVLLQPALLQSVAR